MNVQPNVHTGLIPPYILHTHHILRQIRYRNQNCHLDVRLDLWLIFQMIYSNMLRNAVKQQRY